jgi:hypothetical protein
VLIEAFIAKLAVETLDKLKGFSEGVPGKSWMRGLYAEQRAVECRWCLGSE